MKRAVRTATAFFVLSTVFAACAGSEDDLPANGTGDAGPPDAAKISATDSGGSTFETSAPEKKCMSGCTTDSDCQNSCPAAPNGIYCCDVKSGICYAPAEATCPDPNQTQDDGGQQSY
jgi:hypothetical protein